MIPRYLRFVGALVISMTAGCGAASVDFQQTTLPAATAVTSTPTEIQWFPPSATPAVEVAPTQAATPERKPGVGELVIEDDMTSATHWNAAADRPARTTVSEKGLTISAEPGQPAVVSLHRSAVFDDMYLEVTASPSLCRDRDSYGLVFRAPNDSAHYRLVAICNGTVAAERLSLGTPRVLQPPTASADAPVGAPGEVTLGVWVHGSEFRFFLNDRFQFAVRDSNYMVGGIGVFAQAGGQTPVVVTFTDLIVHRLLPTETTEAPTP